MVKCGKCKGKHANAAAVRSCYQGQTVGVSYIGKTDAEWKAEFADHEAAQERAAFASKMNRVTGRTPTPVYAKSSVRSFGANSGQPITAPAVRMTSAKMAWKIYYLLKEYAEVRGTQFNPESVDECVAAWQEATFSQGWETIDRLKLDIAAARRNPSAKAEADIAITEALSKDKSEAPDFPNTPRGKTPQVPDGRYAIRTDGIVKFYRVNTPTEGRWAGYTFVNVQASDETYPVKGREARNAILTAIARDVEGALKLYGQELGHCGHCGRTLTDETSRSIGIGPVCREKLGY